MAQQNELYDIYLMQHVPFWQTAWFFWMMIVFGLLLTIVIGWYLRKRMGAKKNNITAWDKALHELHQLQEQANTLESKEFYMRLLFSMRTYLQDRYGYDVRGMTDKELLEYLTTVNFSPKHRALLQAMFSGSVLIRFAKGYAIQEHIDRDMDASIIIVKETIPTVAKH